MSFRSRPVLDRKHRPRWQDELRTQQLTVIGFAIAIALALGIFGAAAWNGYWESHFRPIAAVGDTSFDRADLAQRERVLASELIAELTELQAQLEGPRAQLIQQQIDSLSQAFNEITQTAAQSLVDGATLEARAPDFEISVTEADVDDEIALRYLLPERVRADLVLVEALPEDAEPDAEPTDEQRAAAMEEAEAALQRLEGGEAFAIVAADVSDDFTATTGGSLGWFGDQDAAYDDYFDALADAEAGDFVGPIETERGAAVLQLVARRDATTEGGLAQVLRDQGIDDATYRDYLRGELLLEGFREHFGDEVVVSPAPQRRVAEILIASPTGEVVPQERARHVLIAPDPGIENQEEATNEQWDAALAEAREVEELVRADGADWFEIAEEHSDDTGSGARGGDLGWYDPENPGFVTEFAATLADLDVGEISEPIRTEFGYHVVQKTAARESPQEQVAELMEQLRDDPDSFGEVATLVSEDPESAANDGELGWVARYQLARPQEEAVFGLTEVGQIGDPVETINEGTTIFQLLETSESEPVDDDRLEEIRTSGFDRWLDDEVRAPVQSWIDAQYAPSTTTT